MFRAGLFAAIMMAITVVVPADGRFGTKFAFVVDTSGSMRGPKLNRAIEGYAEIAQQSTDEMSMGVWAFESSVSVWPDGWVPLPDKEAVDRAVAWLNGQASNGGTIALPALKAAMAAPHHDLTIVLISDGQFYQESTDSILAGVEAAQVARVGAGWGRAQIAVVAVCEGEYVPPVLKQLAAAGHGGLYVVDR